MDAGLGVFDWAMSTADIAFAVGGYATCSSLMLVMNKVAVHVLPSPSIVLLLQLLASAWATWLAGVLGFIVVDKLEPHKVKAFIPVAAAFLAAVFTNMKTLQYANVETFIVFRASTPILVSICDWWFLGRELPSARSWACLGALVLGALVYVLTDSAFHVSGYTWVCVWYFVFCFDQIYIKHAVDTVKMDSNWGRVYYTNLLSSTPLLLHALHDWSASAPGSSGPLDSFEPTIGSFAAVAVSCALGVAMSYFAFKARSALSATAFTVVGNACKIATVCINLVIWDKHANAIGIVSLLLCLSAAYFYKQAPMRATKTVHEPV